MASKKTTQPRRQSQATMNRRIFASLDSDGQEAWIGLLDQEIRTLGEAARRDYDTFLALVQAMLRAGCEVDETVRALAGIDEKAVGDS